ncbi:hypothetical protein BBJ28_00025837, partial [Nothophytophthora sp. Chile5]
YPGMYIMSINETNASLMSLQQVTQLLGKLARKEKLIRFAVFRPGSPRNRSSHADSNASEASNQRSSVTSGASLPPPVPVTTKPPTPGGGLAGFSTRFASLAASVMDKKPSTPRTSATSPVGAGASRDAAECVHCGMPASAHSSAACPYR